MSEKTKKEFEKQKKEAKTKELDVMKAIPITDIDKLLKQAFDNKTRMINQINVLNRELVENDGRIKSYQELKVMKKKKKEVKK